MKIRLKRLKIPTVPLDAIDRKILEILQREARIPDVDLAERVNLSPSSCLRRVREPERTGGIQRYVALLDPLALGLTVSGSSRWPWSGRWKPRWEPLSAPFARDPR